MEKMLVILGPTSTGKTGLSLSLAKKFNAELISCDSRQVYKDLDLGTGKLTGLEIVDNRLSIDKEEGFWVLDGVKVWMYDVVSPEFQFSVKDFVERVEKILEDLFKRGKLPILVGGTGFYIKAILEGIENLDKSFDMKLRKKLEKFSVEDLQKKLGELSPILLSEMNQSDRKNKRRLIRRIEIFDMYGHTHIENFTPEIVNRKFDVLKIGLLAPRDFLLKKIDQRLDERLSQGLVDEAKNLYKRGLRLKRMKELGLEYGVLADFILGKVNKEDLIQKLRIANHQYAKRQETWFKKEKDVNWFDVSKKDYMKKIEKLTEDWYNRKS